MIPDVTMPQRSPITCEQCRLILAETDGSRLYIGGVLGRAPVVITRKVAIHCGCCGRRRVWNPSSLEVLAMPCYTDAIPA